MVASNVYQAFLQLERGGKLHIVIYIYCKKILGQDIRFTLFSLSPNKSLRSCRFNSAITHLSESLGQVATRATNFAWALFGALPGCLDCSFFHWSRSQIDLENSQGTRENTKMSLVMPHRIVFFFGGGGVHLNC